MSKAPLDHTPLITEKFRGLYSRNNDDGVPEGYCIDILNMKFNKDILLTREGSEFKHTVNNGVRFFEYRKIGETPRYIYLNSFGQFFDSLFPSTPIYTDASITDFSMTVMYNRAYITPHNRIEGAPGKSVLVYTGGGTARIAAGTAPVSFTLAAAENPASGKVETGVHLLAVAFITDTGFITAPGIGTGIKEFTATGAHKIDVSSIPLGGSGTAKRILLATKSIPVSLYGGNKLGYEFFFVPSGTINDNTSTTATIDFYDLDLIDSADYLFDNLSTIPAGVAILTYNQRLVVINEDGNNWTARLSDKNAPETFSGLDGFITVDPSESVSGLRNAFEHRKNLIFCSSDRLYATTDNDTSPSTWQVTMLDKSVGTECFGIATMLDARGTGNDRVWIATRAGVVSFEGYVKRPEISNNIELYWRRINKAYFNLIQIVDDPLFHRLVITVPLDSSTVISHIIYGDYSEAGTVYGTIDERMIKWSIWTMPTVPISIIGTRDVTTEQPVIQVLLTGGIYSIKDGLTDDFGNAIDNYAQFDLKSSRAEWINHFGFIGLRIKGVGVLAVTMFGEDGITTATGPSVTLSSAPGGEESFPINFVNEKMSIKLRVNTFGSRFTINKVTTYAKPLWESRPG